jgi:hypothetical protein
VIIDVPGRLAPYLAVALQRLARQMVQDGHVPPPGLVALADDLLRDDGVTAARRRELAAARSRSYRARQRARQAS